MGAILDMEAAPGRRLETHTNTGDKKYTNTNTGDTKYTNTKLVTAKENLNYTHSNTNTITYSVQS